MISPISISSGVHVRTCSIDTLPRRPARAAEATLIAPTPLSTPRLIDRENPFKAVAATPLVGSRTFGLGDRRNFRV